MLEACEPLQQTDRLKPWTASRCNRLLRPLESKITALRKSALGHGYAHEPSRQRSPRESRKSTDTIPSEANSFSTQDSGFSRRRAKCQKTYTARKGTEPALVHQEPGTGTPRRAAYDIKLPTPFLARIQRQPNTVSKPDAVESNDPEKQGSCIKAPSKKRKMQTSFGSRDAVTSAVNALQTLLVDTVEVKSVSTGPKSLLHLCLAHVPAHVKDDAQSRIEENQDDKSNVSAETYAWLEDFSEVTAERGHCLCRAVRAHGIHLFQEVARDGLIDSAAFGSLVAWCSENEADDAKDSIVSAALSAESDRASSAIVRYDHGKAYHSARILGGVVAGHLVGVSRWQQMSTLLVNKCIPITSLPSPEAEALRVEAVRSMVTEVNDAPAYAAADFVENSLLCAAGVDPLTKDRLESRIGSRWGSASRFIDQHAPTCRPAAEGPQGELLEAMYDTVRNTCTTLLVMGCIGGPDSSSSTSSPSHVQAFWRS